MIEYKINNISDYLRVVNRIADKWDCAEPWFRGITNNKYKLSPSLYRRKINTDFDSEKEMFRQFIRRAKGLISNYDKLTLIDWYCLMQHYGFPTRLLDWTSGALFALFFAVRNNNLKTDKCVYVIDPFAVNKAFHKLDVIFSSDESSTEDCDIINSYLFNNQLPEYPIAIEPPYIDQRVFAQQSCFTIHGNNKTPFELLLAEKRVKFAKIKIDGLFSNDIKLELATAGIKELLIFQDLEGLAREMMFDYLPE